MEEKSKYTNALEQIADLLEFKGENPFKINAFRNAVNVLRSQTSDIQSIIKDGSIKNIKGIGKGIQSVIYDIYENGFSSDLEQLNQEIPKGIIDMLEIRGLGPKKIKSIYSEFGISSIDELEAFCKQDKLKSIKGFGEKTQVLILKEIERINSTKDLMLIDSSYHQTKEVSNTLDKIKSIIKYKVTGQVRRSLEVVDKIEFILLVNDLGKFTDECNTIGLTLTINELPVLNSLDHNFLKDKVNYFKADYFSSIIYFYVFQDEKVFPLLLFITTGSDDFLKEFELDKSASFKEEEDIFSKTDNGFIIPEMREIQYYQLDKSKGKNSVLEQNKFKGFFHFHTNYSDGKNTLQEMVNACKNKGFHYAVVCDHSKSAFYANGLNEDKVLLQKKEIEEVTIKAGIKVFHGIESDILKDGELDYDDNFLNNFDFVVASIHSRFQMSESEMTSRIIKAVENPHTNILGHPTGRLLLKRDGYSVDIKKIIDACCVNKVAIEINSHPQRLDLDWRNIYYARNKGCMFSINPDAHSVEDIDLIKFGISIARKGGVQPEEVLNCLSLNDFQNYLKERKK